MYDQDIRNELTHHGILGMKWGVRRYQNEDGSYTAAGKKRKEQLDKRFESKHPERAAKAEELRSRVIKNQQDNIEKFTKSANSLSKMAEKDLSKMDFDKEAKKELDAELEYLKENFKVNGISGKPTEKDAIDAFYASMGVEAPPGATRKNVAEVIKADTLVFQKNGLYQQLVDSDKAAISKGERIIKDIQDMSLRDIYENKNDIYYGYWQQRYQKQEAHN